MLALAPTPVPELLAVEDARLEAPPSVVLIDGAWDTEPKAGSVVPETEGTLPKLESLPRPP